MIHLTTYHSDNMTRSAQLCKESGWKHGVNQVMAWTRAALEQTEFYEQNKALLDVPRGSGYWAWKPYIILQALEAVGPVRNNVLIYADAGVEFIAPVSHIINQMDDLWLFGNMYNHRDWCKMDTMKAMDVYPDGKQCQASVLFLRYSAKPFVEEWLKWCLTPGMIDDIPSKAPNYPEFQEHRHDQAILTNLAYKYGHKLNWWPAVYNNGAFAYPSEGYTKLYPPLFHHHRRRDSEYT